MKSSTALIIVPTPDPPDVEMTLETMGPFGSTRVHHSPGWHLGADSGLPRPDAPSRPQRSPECEPDYYIDQLNTRRIIALLDTFKAGDECVLRQIAEIRYRVLTLCPLHI